MRTLIGMAAVAVPMTMAISGDFTAGVLAMAGGAVAAGSLRLPDRRPRLKRDRPQRPTHAFDRERTPLIASEPR